MHYHVSGTIAIFSFLKNEGSYWLVLIPQLICAAEIQNFNNCLRNFASIQQCIANFKWIVPTRSGLFLLQLDYTTTKIEGGKVYLH